MTTIAVIGPNECSAEERQLGFDVGAGIAERGGTLVCGGLGGMMEAAAAGAKSKSGKTIGILPGEDRNAANPHIDVAIPTGLGPFRNMLVVKSADAVIAIRGAYGTLSEIAFALRLDIPVIGLNTWSVVQDGKVDDGIQVVNTPTEAVERAFEVAPR